MGLCEVVGSTRIPAWDSERWLPLGRTLTGAQGHVQAAGVALYPDVGLVTSEEHRLRSVAYFTVGCHALM